LVLFHVVAIGRKKRPISSQQHLGFNIEIGGGLGEWRGQVWRIGLMGHSCVAHNVDLLLSAMNTLLHQYRSR
jgi:aspartate aminotransferase-like enzyme